MHCKSKEERPSCALRDPAGSRSALATGCCATRSRSRTARTGVDSTHQECTVDSSLITPANVVAANRCEAHSKRAAEGRKHSGSALRTGSDSRVDSEESHSLPSNEMRVKPSEAEQIKHALVVKQRDIGYCSCGLGENINFLVDNQMCRRCSA